LISVIMPVFNTEKYVGQAINSILAQTYKDFELIIIDDGSTDDTLSILHAYRNMDERIIILENGTNKGVAFSRNRGLERAKGEYIAVMDSDDISLPMRFEVEIAYLKAHPELGALGSNFQIITSDGELTDFKTSYSLSPGINRWRMFFANQHCHPTTLICSSLFTKNGIKYDESIRCSEDYDLWFQINEISKIGNIPEILLYVRKNDTSYTSINHEIVQQSDVLIIMKYIRKYLNLNLDDHLGFGMKYSDQIQSVQDAIQISKIVVLLSRFSRIWNLTNEDKKYIKRSASSKLRAIWHSQKKNIFLLPYVIYSLILYPGVFKTWMTGKIA